MRHHFVPALVLLVVACGSTSDPAPALISAEPPSATPVADAGRDDDPPPVARPGADDAGADAPPAHAPAVATEACSIPGDTNFFIAEHKYPGRSAADLARVVALFDMAGYGRPVAKTRYRYGKLENVFVTDGAVGVYCPEGSTVTFVDPVSP